MAVDAATEDAVVAWLRCKESFWYFCTHYVMVNSASGKGETPFDPTWDYLKPIAEAFESGEHVIVGKARQLGVSWLMAAYDVWLLTFFDSRRVLSISIGERESIDLLNKVKFIVERLPQMMKRAVAKANEREFQLVNGSMVSALPSTVNAGRGSNATVVQTDEFAFHPFAGENFAAYRNSIADGGQHIIVSTGNGPTGLFASMWRAAPGNGYRKFFLPWHVRPDRDQEWYDRELAAFTSAGERHPLLFIRENPSTEEEMLTAFYGLVYESFSPAVVMRPPSLPYRRMEWRVAAIDPGQGDPAAITVVGQAPGSRAAHVFGPSFYSLGTTGADEMYAYLRRWYNDAPLHAVVVDGAEGTLVATLNAWFLRDYGREPVVAANKERGVGIGLVAGRLKSRLLTVDQSETGIQREFQTYRWKERRAQGESDPYSTSTPVDHHADRLDTIRYALMWLAQYATPSGEPPPVDISEPTPTYGGGFVDHLSRARADGVKLPSRPIPSYRGARVGPRFARRR